jgi:hypothetical protein
MAKALGAKASLECSALTGQGSFEVFQRVAEILCEQRKEETSVNSTNWLSTTLKRFQRAS